MLLVTRHAPCCPEVDHGRLAAQRREIDCSITADFLQRKRRRRASHQWRLDLLRISAQAEEKNGHESGGDGDSDDEDGAVHALAISRSFRLASLGVRMTWPRIGIKAISPPRPMTRAAIQIHITIGVTIMCNTTLCCATSTFRMDR